MQGSIQRQTKNLIIFFAHKLCHYIFFVLFLFLCDVTVIFTLIYYRKKCIYAQAVAYAMDYPEMLLNDGNKMPALGFGTFGKVRLWPFINMIFV